MNLMDLFKRVPAPNAKPNPDPNADPNKDPNNKDTKDPNDPNNKDKTKSVDPLEAFKGLWHNPNPDDANSKAPTFALDPEGVKTLVSSLSFSDSLTPELVQKLQSGDATATKQVLDDLGRATYSKIFEHLPVLTGSFIEARLNHERQGLGKGVKQELTRNSLSKLAANNPILQEQLETLGQQLLSKFPDATPEWIAEQSQGYFLAIAKALQPDAFKDTGESKGSKGEHMPGQELPADFWANWVEGKPTSVEKK